MSAKVIEFKPKEKEKNIVKTVAERQEEIFQQMKASYISVQGLEVDNFETAQQMFERMKVLFAEGKEIVFQNVDQAIGMGSVLLELPEYQDISHFQVELCVSRLSVFYKLVPVAKDDRKYAFLDEDMNHTINLEMMQKMALEVAQETEDVN
jgi:hypothetical protein